MFEGQGCIFDVQWVKQDHVLQIRSGVETSFGEKPTTTLHTGWATLHEAGI